MIMTMMTELITLSLAHARGVSKLVEHLKFEV